MPTLAICARFKRRGKFVHKRLLSDIGISNEEWERACRANLALRNSTGKNFFAEAIRKNLNAPKDDGITELEQATAQSNALTQLLADKFDHLANRSGTPFDGDSANALVFGIGELARITQQRLENSFKRVFQAQHPKSPEVAS